MSFQKNIKLPHYDFDKDNLNDYIKAVCELIDKDIDKDTTATAEIYITLYKPVNKPAHIASIHPVFNKK